MFRFSGLGVRLGLFRTHVMDEQDFGLQSAVTVQ